MKYFLLIFLATIATAVYSQTNDYKNTTMTKNRAVRKTSAVACKLTSPEMQKRKATVIKSLKDKVLEKKELENGYAYKFNGTDLVIDALTDFIKAERLCCEFFDFELKITGDASNTWLTITGPARAKDFIKTELEF